MLTCEISTVVLFLGHALRCFVVNFIIGGFTRFFVLILGVQKCACAIFYAFCMSAPKNAFLSLRLPIFGASYCQYFYTRGMAPCIFVLLKS